MSAIDVKEFKALQAENARLKRLVADQALDIQVLKEANAPQGHFFAALRAQKSGRRTSTTTADSLGAYSGSVFASCVRAFWRSSVNAGLRIKNGGA